MMDSLPSSVPPQIPPKILSPKPSQIPSQESSQIPSQKPPQIPPKKSKKPQIPLGTTSADCVPLVDDTNGVSEQAWLSTNPNRLDHTSNTPSTDSSHPPKQSRNSAEAMEYLDSVVHSMMDSLRDNPTDGAMSRSVSGIDNIESNMLMTSSLPLPVRTQSARPVPKPRPSVRNHVPANRSQNDQSPSNSGSPKPVPKARKKLQKSESKTAPSSAPPVSRRENTTQDELYLNVSESSGGLASLDDGASGATGQLSASAQTSTVEPTGHDSMALYANVTDTSSTKDLAGADKGSVSTICSTTVTDNPSVDAARHFSADNGDSVAATKDPIDASKDCVAASRDSAVTPRTLPSLISTGDDRKLKRDADPQVLQTPDSAGHIYGNAMDEDQASGRSLSQFPDVHGIPLAPSVGETPAVTPLSPDTRKILDPTEYMSLWELNSAEQPTTAVEPVADEDLTPVSEVESTGRRMGPPIPPRLGDTFTFPQVNPSPTTEQTTPTAAQSSVRRDRCSVHAEEFRNSYLLPLPADPFADVLPEDIFADANASVVGNDTNAPVYASVYSIAEEPEDKKLIPIRRAPPIPSAPRPAPQPTIPEVTTPPTPVSEPGIHYSKIDKHKAAVQTQLSGSGDPAYCLADEVADWMRHGGFENQAGLYTSYDSEDTVDEDSDSSTIDQPDLPPKILPVAPSPRLAQTDRHGYLYKQGGKQYNKGWRKRYVTFDGERLKYFSTEKSRISKRIIPVQVMKCVENDVKDMDSGKFRFRVVTFNRVYLFAAETLEDHHFWTNILMKSIILFNKKNGGRGSIGQGMMRGGTMHSPDIEGFVKLDEAKNFLAIKEGKLCYYNNENDYQFATAIHEVSLNTASVKDIGKNKLQLTTPYHTYILGLDTEGELEEWKIALADGIASALSDDNVLNEVYQNPSNRLCADCSAAKPHWAVLHLSTIVCSNCAGIHRQFWPFKVKSLRMDTKVWTKPLINLYTEVGNKTINSVWEDNRNSSSEKVSSASSLSQRRIFIIKKYLHKSFFTKTLHQLPQQPSPQHLCQALNQSIKAGSITDVIYLINRGADPLHSSPDTSQTPSQLADASNRPHIAQYIKLNGAEHESLSDIWGVIRKQNSEDSSVEPKVVKSGHLLKMHSTKRGDYPRQWMVLTMTSLKCYDEETNPEPKLTVACRSIVNLCRHTNEKNEPSFEFTCNHDGNTYVYGASDWPTILSWMTELHKVITAQNGHSDLGLDFSKAGHVHCKRGSLGQWKWCWLLLKKKQLFILDSKSTWSQEVDLRKVKKLSLCSADETTAACPGEEGGPFLVLFLSDHYVYIQSDIKQVTEKWHKVIDDSWKDISHNLEDQQLNKSNVPVLVEKCIEFISVHGMTVEGIYRHSGTHSKVTNLLNDFITGARSVHIKLEDYSVHDVANVLKRYLRNLQEPVMSSLLYGKWLSATMLTRAEVSSAAEREMHDQKLCTYKELLEQLQPINFATLKVIIAHLCRVTKHQPENKMTKGNIGIVFGPVLLSGSSVENPTQQSFMNTSFECQLVIDLMENYPWLFSVDQSELDREDVIQQAIDRIASGSKPAPCVAAGDFIHYIYAVNNLSEPMNIKVSAHMTAADVVKKVVEAKRIPRIDGYSLFEVVCAGELERPLSEHEKVLDVLTALSTWSDDHKKDHYLCVKEDTLRDSLEEQASGLDIPRFTDLHYSERRGWKKMFFELIHDELICYKDKSNTKACEWSVSELSLYVGVERKRKPPTAFGITFLCSSDDQSKLKDLPHLGRSLCFNTAAEMFTWLSSIYYNQSQDTLGLQLIHGNPARMPDKKTASPKLRLPSLKNPFRR